VLLSQEPDAVENLSRSRPRRFEPLFEIGILDLQTLDTFGVHPRSTGRTFERLEPRLGLKGAPPECRELFAKMPHELLKLLECLQFRTFAV
jgi:hypothetical protein